MILCKTAIIFGAGGSLNGRGLTQTAVTMIATTIVAPHSMSAAVASAPSAPPLRQPVDLGTAERFALLTKTGITTTGVTSVTETLILTLPLPLPLPLFPPLTR